MATFITVEQKAAQQLLEANSRQTAANRTGLARQEQARRELRDEPKPEAQVFGAQRPVLEGDQLAATRRLRQKLLTLIHAWIASNRFLGGGTTGNNLLTDGTFTSTANGDGTYTSSLIQEVVVARLEELFVTDFQPSGTTAATDVFTASYPPDTSNTVRSKPFLILPVDGKSFVMICYGYRYSRVETYTRNIRDTSVNQWSELTFRSSIASSYVANSVTGVTVTSSAEKVSRAFLVSASSAREITIPARVAAFIDSINADFQQVSQTYQIWSYPDYTPSTVTYQVHKLPTQYLGTYWDLINDCRIYAVINQAAIDNGLDPLFSGITEPTLDAYLYEDPDRSVHGDAITTGTGLYAYLLNNVDNQSTATSAPQLDYSYPQAREVRFHTAASTLKQNAYCRHVLLAMGFQAGDLVP